MKTAKQDVIAVGTMLLKFVLEHEDGQRTQYDRPIRSKEEWDRILVRALAWESEGLTGVKGRKIRAFCPGHFSMTTVLGIVNYWTPRNEKKLDALFGMVHAERNWL